MHRTPSPVTHHSIPGRWRAVLLSMALIAPGVSLAASGGDSGRNCAEDAALEGVPEPCQKYDEGGAEENSEQLELCIRRMHTQRMSVCEAAATQEKYTKAPSERNIGGGEDGGGGGGGGGGEGGGTMSSVMERCSIGMPFDKLDFSFNWPPTLPDPTDFIDLPTVQELLEKLIDEACSQIKAYSDEHVSKLVEEASYDATFSMEIDALSEYGIDNELAYDFGGVGAEGGMYGKSEEEMEELKSQGAKEWDFWYDDQAVEDAVKDKAEESFSP